MNHIHKTREDYSSQFGISDAFIPGMEYAEIETEPIQYKAFKPINREPSRISINWSPYLDIELFGISGEITQARLIAESLGFEPFDTLDTVVLECEKDITSELVVES